MARPDRRTIVVAMALGTGLSVGLAEAARPDAGSTPSAPEVRPIRSTTRLVALFSGLEQRWLRALQDHDVPTLESLLDEGFELRLASRPDQPIPRAEYLRQAAGPTAGGHVAQMAARDLGGVVIVSFQLETEGGGGAQQRVFVIDAWHSEGGSSPESRSGGISWKAVARYVASTRAPGFFASGLPEAPAGEAETLPKKF